jgi:hypothetical protein
MGYAHTKAERAHAADVVHMLHELLEGEFRNRIVGGKKVREALYVITSPPSPWQLAQIHSVVNSVLGKS